MHILYIRIYLRYAKVYQESGHITCRKYLQKQSQESCRACDGATTFSYLQQD